jgi:sugar phosphate isomerase/epimerase
MSNKDYKLFLDDLGVSMVSSHVDINKDFEKKAAQAAEIGMEYLVCPYIGPQISVDAWKKVTDRFNECGKICKKNGIRFAYHNHAYSFKAFSGMIPHDFLMDNTDPELVDHEMDIYWVVTGGADPIEYLKKYPNRFRLCHVKDRKKDAAADENSASCDLGTGQIDFPKILKVAAETGMKYFIMEQERYDNTTPMQSVEVGANYLKKLVFA